MNLAERLKQLRKKNKLTQDELARRIGISKITIVQYETNKRTPNFEIMAKLEKYFNASAAYLLGETDINNYQDITEEYFYELNNFTIEMENFKLWLNKLEREQQLEAVTCFNALITMLIHNKVADEEQYFFVENLASVLLELQRFFSYLNMIKSKNIDTKNIINYIQTISEEIFEFVEMYQIKSNITKLDLFNSRKK